MKWNTINTCSKFGFSDNLFLNFSIGSSSGGCAGPFCASMTGGGNALLFENSFYIIFYHVMISSAIQKLNFILFTINCFAFLD